MKKNLCIAIAGISLVSQRRSFGEPMAFAPVVRGENKLIVRNDGEAHAEIDVIGSIGKNYWDDSGISEKEFRDALKSIPNGKKITIKVNSEGGNVKDGLGIYNAIRDRKADVTCVIHGYALSIASIFPLAASKVISPKSAIWMIHKAWSWAQGNADDMRQQAEMLDTHDETLAGIYAEHTGKTKEEILADMEKETWIKGADAVAYGLADEGDPEEEEVEASAHYRPLHADFVNRCKNVSPAILNCISKAALPARRKLSAPKQGANKPANHQPQNTVNKKQKIALLATWGLTVSDATSMAVINQLVNLGKTAARASVTKNEANKFDDVQCAEEVEETEEEEETEEATTPANRRRFSNFAQLDAETQADIKALRQQAQNQRRNTIKVAVEHAASVDGGCKIPANQIDIWINDAMAVEDGPKGNPVLNRLAALEEKKVIIPLAGLPPDLQVVEGPMNIAQLNKAVASLLKAQQYNAASSIRSGKLSGTMAERETIAINAKAISRAINAAKKYDYSKDPKGELIGPLRDAWDAWANGFGGVQNANTMSTDLLRQVILSEFMRAFRREFAPLSYFAHNYGSIALQGNNKVEVPYYPLNTTASTEFKYADGYVVGANATTNSKEIIIGGKGDGVASPGSFRKYQSLKFTAYEMARQPWLNIAQLIVMQAEQLAVDVRAEILGYWINRTNFGDAIWTGAAGGFNENVVALYLKQAADVAFWPKGGRNMILTPAFYNNLAAQPYVKAYMNIGSTDTIRQGKIGGLYGFQDTVEDVMLPIANFIQGGDGVVTNGTDPYLAGFIAWMSALLIATAPIMPGPATMRLLASFEQVTDDQTGLSFTYQYFGNPLTNADSEIIECTGGSGLGELAALKRIVTQGL